MSLIVKIKLFVSLLSLRFLLPAGDKTQYFVHLSFNFALQSINDILSNLQKLLKYFNGTAIVASFRIPLTPSVSVISNTLALYINDLKLTLLNISALKLVASSLE